MPRTLGCPVNSVCVHLVERWFAELTNRKLLRSAHRSVAELEADIRAWIEAWNEDPRPLVWTRTADEILESLAGYLARINDSGHQLLVSITALAIAAGTPVIDQGCRSLSTVIGRSRTRMPVAWCTALAIAAAVPTMPSSPMPLDPIGLTYGSSSRTQSTSIEPTSALVAM